MIGTDPDGQGGVASVVAVYRRAGFFPRQGVVYVCTHRGGSLFTKLGRAVLGGGRIALLLLTGRVSLVHAHVSSHGSFKRKALYLALARRCGVPTVFHLHSGGFRRFVEEEASPRLRERVLNTLRTSSHLIALSQSWADYLRTLAPTACISVLPNPVDMPAQHQLVPGEPGRILFLGRASETKGVYDLLTAFADVVKTHAHARLAIGGDGDLGRLRARISELSLDQHVEVLGWVAGEQKFSQFARSQIYVLPSYHEGLPMGMLEAMAFAKAVVVSPVGGVPEAIEHGVHGLLVQPGDVNGLARALSTLLADEQYCQELGTAARARVDACYSTPLVLERLSFIYEQVLEPKRSTK
ncbi:glycosyltransferase involved in cell wall biosynthesis [Roseateles asaccharophilus]|uniref:Glycosyltransferase involved in cell wall biosynthesis n=2 Tax=Roseateles asaccharophilus TaxID=582607 RepID=A0A4R6MY19_9BURK|nr:glycosyltransferase involved in cell wall biosynthesis [Roseateles asaccharophilus]